MPQIFQVLRCYKCSIFQIHQTKKNNKWICKICGEKQSIKRHYDIGTGKECRLHVQKLNKLQSENVSNSDISDSEKSNSDSEVSMQVSIPRKSSKWSHYTEENDMEQEPISVNYRENDGGIQSKCENSIVDDLQYRHINGGAMLQNTQTFEPKRLKLAQLSSTSQLHSFNEMNESSKSTNFVNFHKENHSPQHTTFKYDDNIDTEMKIFNKDFVNSSSKWASFLDDNIDSGTKYNINSSDNVTHTNSTKNNNAAVKDTTQQFTKNSLLNKKQTEMQGIPKLPQYKQSFFSMSDEQDLDSILDVKF